jgi:hypothetical protein
MPAKDLGIKHQCYQCATKFYDLKKPVPICPKCGADQRQAPATPIQAAPEPKRGKAKGKTGGKTKAAKAAVAPVPDLAEGDEDTETEPKAEGGGEDDDEGDGGDEAEEPAEDDEG